MRRSGTGRAPAGGAGKSSFVLMTDMIVVAQLLRAGAFQTAEQMRAPGFATRVISAIERSMLGKNMNPKRQVTASNALSPNGISPTSHWRVSKFRRPARAALSAAPESMPSERSVQVTRPCVSRFAAVRPGSPVPAATSSRCESGRRRAESISERPTGASQPSTFSSHFFQPGENLSQVSRCWSRIWVS